MMKPSLALVVLLSAVTASAEHEYGYGRIRYVEPGVTIQRASEAGAEEAVANLPFLPGDRLWTDEDGRAEFQFADGSILRLDTRSKLDYADQDDRSGADRAVLRLWSGSLFLHLRQERGMSFEIETAGGLVETERWAVLRIDVEGGEARVSVYEGQAILASGRGRVRVQAGERSHARRGRSPEAPRRFDRSRPDEFAEWDREREERAAWASRGDRYLPDEIDPYAGDLDDQGAWYHESDVGYVWAPYVGSGWHPYTNGRWAWTVYGWTWVPYERWGWVPFHYGRWGHSLRIGWYWIPGRQWGPAWVSWAIGRDRIGWCALGRQNRPVIVSRGSRDRGYAVPRGSAGSTPETRHPAPGGGHSSPWTFVQKEHLSAPDIAKRRLEITNPDMPDLQIIESSKLRPSRDLVRVEDADSMAIPRNIRTKPTMGDTIPELRTDPATTIRAPIPRHRYPSEAEKEHQGKEGGPRLDDMRQTERPASPAESQPTRDTAVPRVVVPERRGEKPVEGDIPVRTTDPDRDVLRRFFRPLAEPRSQPRNEDRPRSEGTMAPGTPRTETAAPRVQPSGPTGSMTSGGSAPREAEAVEREKDKNPD